MFKGRSRKPLAGKVDRASRRSGCGAIHLTADKNDPDDARHLVGERHCGDVHGPARQQRHQPRRSGSPPARMPEMDGLELLRALAARGPLPPVIVITGHGEVPIAVEAMKLGARDFLEKPFAPGDLIASIRNVLPTPARPAAGTPEPEICGRLELLTPREREVLEQLV